MPSAKSLRQAKGSEEAVRGQSISLATYQRWKSEYGGMKTDALKRLKELEKENGRLKRIVAELTIDKIILKEAVERKW